MRIVILWLLAGGLGRTLWAQGFIHPGGLHTLADLDRMRTNVMAGNHPWIDDWNVLVTDPEAQSNYNNHATADMGSNRQNADADAHAAYLNAIRWYVSGDVNYANAATNILNRWSAAVNQVPSNTGLVGLPIMSFALAGELLRAYSGWNAADFASYTNMMETYLYPACNNYLTNNYTTNPTNAFQHWTSWDAPNNAAIIAIGVLCDDTNKYDQAVNFFKYGYGPNGVGTGAISNAFPYLYPGPLAQADESGRDQEHDTLGIADMGVVCQVAWNQGLDLFGFANNRLLAGVEYVAQYNLWHNVPYTAFNDSANDNLFYISDDGRGRIDDRPVYEMFYNHYVVLKGLSAPNTRAMAQLYRPEHGSPDHFGYGTLTYTLDAAASPYPPMPVPPAPTGLTARSGISRILLHWAAPSEDLVQSYNVLRSTTSGGPYIRIATRTASTEPDYIDANVVNGTTYYYVVSAANQNGTSGISAEAGSTPAFSALPNGWTQQDVGVVTNTGSTVYTGAGDNTFVITGYGTGIGGTGDGGFNYTYCNATNNFTIIARLTDNNADQMGLMMRASLATNAALVQFFMANNARQSVYGIRTGTGSNLNHYNSGDQFTYLPAWYKLTRSGNTFTAYQSADGINWRVVNSTSIAMPAVYYAGLAINEGSAIFDNVVYTNAAVNGDFEPPAVPAGLTAAAQASNQVYLSWTVVTNAAGYDIRRSTVSGSGYTLIASNIEAAGYYDTTAAADTAYYYVVSAINGGGESANSAEAGVTTPGASPPAAPDHLAATPETSLIELTWAASIGASSYNIKRSTNGGISYTSLATGAIADFVDANVAGGTRYYYVVSAVNAAGESPDSAPASAVLLVKLTGAVIGTPGSFGNFGNTISNVFDGNLSTFFDGPDASGDWAGLDFGSGVSNVIGTIQYCPRATFANRMVGGIFQGANDPGFTNPVTLFTVTAAPAYSVMTSQIISETNAFRYVRYLGPNNGNCNVAEVEFDGGPALPPPPEAPTGLAATAGDAQVLLSWNAAGGATGYDLKRSTQSGTAYVVIATNLANLSYTNVGLSNGVSYYFVVSATNAGGESANSSEVIARPVSFTPPRMSLNVNGNRIQFAWPADHAGWSLQAQTNAAGGGLGSNWVTVPGSDLTNEWSMPVDPANGNVYFRLVYP